MNRLAYISILFALVPFINSARDTLRIFEADFRKKYTNIEILSTNSLFLKNPFY